MGIMADRLNSMVIRVTSPDGQFHCVYSAADGASIEFREAAFDNYTERALERQLTQVANRLWSGYSRAFDMALEEATGEKPAPVARNWDARRRRLQAEKAETTFEGMSAGKNVFIQTVGTHDWKVVIRDSALSRMEESGFGDELASAFTALVADCQHKTAQLRTKHYREPVRA